jgi:hypothetical protein
MRFASRTHEAGGFQFASAVAVSGFTTALVIGFVSNNGGPDSHVLLTWVLGAMLLSLGGHEWRRVGHPLTPAGIVAMGGLLLFFLRPLTVASAGTTTAGALADTRMFIGVTVEAAGLALLQLITFFAAFILMYLQTLYGRTRSAAPREVGFASQSAHLHRTALLLGLSIALAVTITTVLVYSSGGIVAHFGGVSLRSAFLSGRYYMTLGYVPLSISLCLYVIVRRGHYPDRSPWTSLATTGAVVLVLTAFATGGRGPVILGAVIPLLILKQLGPRPLRTASLLAVGLTVVAGAMVMSLVLRENSYTGGAALSQLSDRPLASLLERLTSGAETRPFDSLILLNEADLQGRLDLQMGRTYLTVPTWFLPGSVATWKSGGANTWFTMEYLPRFYYPDHIETSISAIGEAFANFGWVGVPLAGAAVGWFAARISAYRGSPTVHATLIYVVLSPLFFSLVRGDSYQNLSLIILTAGLATAFSVAVRAGNNSLNSRHDSGASASSRSRTRTH